MESTTPTAAETLWAAKPPEIRWQLHVLSSPDRHWQGRIVPIGPRGVVLGRATEMVEAHDIGDPLLSRRHLELRPGPRADVLDLRDLGSKNGTWRGAQRVANVTLGHDGIIRFGSSLAIVEGDLATAMEYAHPTQCIPGRSGRARQLRADIQQAANGIAPVLLLGPTGAGKEFVVRELHARSGREGPLVFVGAPTLSESAFEAEFFGAIGTTGSKGLLDEAAEGTLVLDEIAELPLTLQAKLLRFLESGCYRPVGAPQEVASRTRIVATTNADLEALAGQGKFRRDLLARLRSHVVTVPALAERRSDFLECADVVAPLSADNSQRWAQVLSPDALEALLHYGWPENLRELATVLQALAPKAGPRPLARDDLPGWLLQATGPTGRTGHPVGPLALTPDATVLRRLLQRHYGNIAKVAAHYSRDRRQIYRWLEQAGVTDAEVAQFRRGP